MENVEKGEGEKKVSAQMMPFPWKPPMSTKLYIYNNNRDRNYFLRHQQIMCNFWIHNPIKYTHSILNIVNVLVVVVVISSRMCSYA